MNWKSGILVGLVIIIGLGLLWCFGEVGADVPTAKSIPTASASIAVKFSVPTKTSAMSEPALNARSNPVPSSKVGPRQIRMLSPYICEDCKPSPFVAKSPAEAAWMQRAGFPTLEMRKNMATLPMDSLKAKADAGDLAAMAIYGIRLAQMGSVLDGEFYLWGAQVQGSIYACYGLAQAKLQPGPQHDRFTAASEIRLAMLLGDARASDYLYRTFPDFDAKDFAGIDNRASVLLHRLMARAFQVYGSFNGISIRPMAYDNVDKQAN